MGAELFAVPFAFSLIMICVAERALNAIMCLVFRVSPWKQLAAQNVLVRLVDLGASLGTVATRTLVDVGVRLLGLWILFVTAFVMFSAVWVTYEEYPETWLGMVRFYNANLGPFLSYVFVWPLQVTDILVRALLPIWDAGVWWGKALLFQGLLPMALQEIKTLLKIATTLFGFAQDSANAVQVFSESFRCAGEACLVPENRVFDLLSGMGQVRQLVALARELVAAFCGTISAPADLIVFPLLDLNLAIGLHNLWNFALQLVTVVPHVTTVRCAMAYDNTFGVMMCIPDLEPAFNFLVAGISSLGLMVDNWVNVAFAIVQNTVTGSSPTCDALVPQLDPTAFLGSAVFGNNFTAVVGLTQWMYAVTDGYTAIYKGSDEAGVRAQRWPYAMDASLGVAAVSYGPMSDLDASTVTGARTVGSLQTTAMMACNCSNTGDGVQILCAILPLNGLPSSRAESNYLLQVLFPDEQTARLIGTCDQVDVSVHSNRFSATRYATTTVGLGTSTATLPSVDCVTRGTCREVDATVYVVPRCGVSDTSMMCISACFPFCMAVRPAGSANNNLQLVPASRWRSGYTTLAQDCAVDGSTVVNVGTSLSPTRASSTVTSPPGQLTSGIATGVFAAGPTRACQPVQRVMSFQPGAGTVPLRAATRLSGQPLFTTGDTVFTERALGGGASAVVVERLTSDDRSTFTLSTLNQDFPALASLAVQSDENTFDDPGRMLIPTAGYYQPTIAVSSRCVKRGFIERRAAGEDSDRHEHADRARAALAGALDDAIAWRGGAEQMQRPPVAAPVVEHELLAGLDLPLGHEDVVVEPALDTAQDKPAVGATRVIVVVAVPRVARRVAHDQELGGWPSPSQDILTVRDVVGRKVAHPAIRVAENRDDPRVDGKHSPAGDAFATRVDDPVAHAPHLALLDL